MNDDDEPVCQACGKILKEEPGEKHLGALVVYRPIGGDDHIQFVVCLNCQKDPADLVVGKYKERIRTGLDLNYH